MGRKKLKKTLLTNVFALTLDYTKPVLKDSYVLIDEKGFIERVTSTPPRNLTGVRKINCKNLLLAPGLINSHTHIAMPEFKGLCHKTPSQIYRVMFPAEKKLVKQDVHLLALAGAIEAAKSGSTMVFDHYYFAQEVSRALSDIGMRGLTGYTYMDRLGPHTGRKHFQSAVDHIEQYADHDLILPCLAPHSPETVSKEWLVETRRLARKHRVPVHMHLSQTQNENKYVKRKYATSPVKLLHRIGLLNKNLIAAHCIYVDNRDIDLLAKKNVNIAYCPASLVLFERLSPIEKFIRKKARILLGTDCVGTNNNMDMIEEMRTAFLLTSERLGTPYALKTIDCLKVAVSNPARVISNRLKTGKIAKGYAADMIALDLFHSRMNPRHDMAENLVFSACESTIKFVMVGGKKIVEDGQVLGVNEKDVVKELNKFVKTLFGK